MKHLKNLTILILVFLNLNLFSQEIMDYEREILNQENFLSYDYSIFQKEENFNLKGTLITPKKNYDKIVIIVPGAGKDSRNSHFILTEFLLENDIAVFRYDERGVGLSEGKYSDVSNTTSNMINDLFYVFNEIKSDEKFLNKKIGLIGHSLGGLLTVGAIEKGIICDFLIQWATPVQSATEMFKYQIKTGINMQSKNLKYKEDKMKFTVMDSIARIIDGNKKLDDISLRKVISNKMKTYGYKKKDYGWYISFPSYLDLLKKDFISVYKNIRIPTLYIIGSKDKFVDPIENIAVLKSLDNKNIEIKLFESLNHYLNVIELTEPNSSMYEVSREPKIYILNWILNK